MSVAGLGMNGRRQVFATTQGRFHLSDGGSSAGASVAPAPEAVARRLTAAQGFLGVGTAEVLAQVAVTVEVLEAAPPADGLERWAFVVEGAIELRSGHLLVGSSAAGRRPAITLDVAPGAYRARIACDRGEHAPVIPGGTETYRIELWPAVATAARVLHSKNAEA